MLDVTSYVTHFRKCIQHVPDPLSDADLTDQFIRGLHVELQKEVLLAMPSTFNEAAAMAERVAAVLRFTRGRS